LKKTKRWAHGNTQKLQELLRSFDVSLAAHSRTDISRWIDANIKITWPEQIRRLNGLFDREFVPYVANVLGVSPDELEKVRVESADPAVVSRLVKRGSGSDLFGVMLRAYWISALLRGRYHEYTAQASGLQILSHPAREPVLLKTKSAELIHLDASNTERFLANIVLAGAFAEGNHLSRVAVWAENVSKLRNARDQINLAQKDREETARDTAIDAAKKFGVRVHSRQLETVLDVGVALSSAALTTWGLAPWIGTQYLPWAGFIVGPAISVLASKTKADNRMAGAMTARKGNLAKLSQMVPGRIGRDFAHK
jgi:hypothetical protein